jgi:hypothetical protein
MGSPLKGNKPSKSPAPRVVQTPARAGMGSRITHVVIAISFLVTVADKVFEWLGRIQSVRAWLESESGSSTISWLLRIVKPALAWLLNAPLWVFAIPVVLAALYAFYQLILSPRFYRITWVLLAGYTLAGPALALWRWPEGINAPAISVGPVFLPNWVLIVSVVLGLILAALTVVATNAQRSQSDAQRDAEIAEGHEKLKRLKQSIGDQLLHMSNQTRNPRLGRSLRDKGNNLKRG